MGAEGVECPDREGERERDGYRKMSTGALVHTCVRAQTVHTHIRTLPLTQGHTWIYV